MPALSGLAGRFRLALLLFVAQLFGPLRLRGERGPRGLRPAATLAHMVERRRISIRARLIDAREEESQVRVPDYRDCHVVWPTRPEELPEPLRRRLRRP